MKPKYKLLIGFLLLSFSVNFLIYCKNGNTGSTETGNALNILKDSTDKNKDTTVNKLKNLEDVFRLHYESSVIDTHNDLL